MVRLYILKSRPQRNNMSFKSALRNTQINQRYRQNAAELQNIDRGIIDSQNAYARQDNLKNNALQALSSTSLLAGSLGKNLTSMDKNIKFGKEQGLKFGGWTGEQGLLNPFKEGGFGATFSKAGGPNMTIADLGKTKNLMDWSNAYMPKNPLEFGDASSISMADNPMISLMSLYNQRFNKPKSKPKHQVSSMDGSAGYEKYLEDERLRKEKEDYELNNLGEII